MGPPAAFFTPGTDALPPALTGRRREGSVFLPCLAARRPTGPTRPARRAGW